VRIAAHEDDRVAGLESHFRLRLVGELRPAPAVHHDVEGDDVIEAGHDLAADTGHGRRGGNPGLARRDVEIHGAREVNRSQHVGKYVHLAFSPAICLDSARHSHASADRRTPGQEFAMTDHMAPVAPDLG
jgi:hypothetical protein